MEPKQTIVKKGPINKDIDKQAYSEGVKKSSLNYFT